jgi:Tfp pilus assembly protein PilX
MQPLPERQRGGATLIVTMVLAIAVLITVVFVNRHLVVEQRIASRHQQASAAFHAAEAGVDWALARLADTGPADATCPLRAGLRASCRYIDGAWTCTCPAAASAEPASDAAFFEVAIEATARTDALRIVSTGRARGAADARAETIAAHLGAIGTAPAAALTVRGTIDAGSAALGAHNADRRSGGLVMHAGGAISASAARIEPPGAMPRADAVIAFDPVLAARTPEGFFAATFGMTRDVWQSRPGVHRVACPAAECGAELAAAIEAGHRALWIDGDAAITGPLTLGSATQPVALVAAGSLTLRGGVTLHGLLYASGLEWIGGAAPTAAVHGAVVVDGSYRGTSAADLVRDADVLNRLAHEVGDWVRVPGSWRDF